MKIYMINMIYNILTSKFILTQFALQVKEKPEKLTQLNKLLYTFAILIPF